MNWTQGKQLPQCKELPLSSPDCEQHIHDHEPVVLHTSS